MTAKQAHAHWDGMRLVGELTRWNVPQLMQESDARLQSTPAPVIDLSGLTQVDSAALALMIDWRQRYPDCRFDHLPTQLLTLMDGLGVTSAMLTSKEST